MQYISHEEAQQFLETHFKLFLDKQKEAGYECQIIIDSPHQHTSTRPYFYVQFCKDQECAKCYKIVC
jgi:hypothetical protein